MEAQRSSSLRVPAIEFEGYTCIDIRTVLHHEVFLAYARTRVSFYFIFVSDNLCISHCTGCKQMRPLKT